MSENAVPIEEMNHEELRAAIQDWAHRTRLVHFDLAACLGRLSHLDQVGYLPCFAERSLPQPCPHFDPPKPALTPPVDIPHHVVNAASEFARTWPSQPSPSTSHPTPTTPVQPTPVQPTPTTPNPAHATPHTPVPTLNLTCT